MSEESNSEEVYSGALIHVRVRTVEQPRGGTTRFEIVEHPSAVAIVALRDDLGAASPAEPLVALVRQQRPAISAETWEIPAGLIRDDERDDPTRTAARELREETGATAQHWRLLAREYPSPGYSTEWIAIYLATGIEASPNARPDDPTEILGLRWVPFSQALELCASGAVQDGKTLLGLTLARDALRVSTLATGGTTTMPLDPTNPPFTRSARYRDPADLELPAERATAPASGRLDASLKIEDMLLEEFNYASVTAYQALEDRARMFNLYVVIIGVLASGLGALFQLGKGSVSDFTAPLSTLALLIAWLLWTPDRSRTSL
ncbi:MAG: NUDIX hydrolase, partial [Ktedonobacterales bacterium]|nr:NUDIX hydrolase [Ktedonobacterales bacterium]